MAGLTKKDRHLLKLASDCHWNEAAVARKIGITHQAVNARLQKIRKKASFAQIMDSMGMTDDYLSEKIHEGMVATKTKIIKKKTTDKDGNIVEQEEIIEIPDIHVRHKYLHTALESKKIIRDPKELGAAIIGISINYGHRKDTRPDNIAVRCESVDATATPA